MTNQEIFTTVKTHLLSQQAKSVLPAPPGVTTPTCAYRGVNGLRCAVGCLIPDELYDRYMEGKSIEDIFVDYPALDSMFCSQLSLLDHLRGVHDDQAVEDWPAHLKRVAGWFNLQYE